MARSNRSRTVTALAALVVAMGVGAFVLIMMETPPARPPVLRADAADGSDATTGTPQSPAERDALLRRTDVPIQPIKWRNIVLYDAADNRAAPPHASGGCHFLIGTAGANGDGTVGPTSLWRQQLDGNHVRGGRHPYNNENSIGIRLFCDTSRSPPTSGQMSALTDLVRALQVICQIPSDRVYIHSGPGKPGRLGRFFPIETFRSRLITARR
ncbi:MAG: N-acetylmuramoyl-L-alanine amidase [Phycisphaerae bacterium]|nr:N-acetylmuramoyl-L-alanine amidase [Phycisphaerae bacterium]